MQNWSNLVTMFFDQAASLKDKPFLWAKQGSQYQSRSWAEVAGAVSALARGLRDLGIVDGDRVVLVSENRPEWLIAEVAIMAAGAIPVPAYTTNTVNDHAHILGNSGAKGAIVSTAELAERLIPAAHAADAAKFVISIEPLKQTQSVNADLLLWSDVLDRGRTKPDDIAERLKSIQRRDLAVADASRDPEVAAILAAFPGAEIIDVRLAETGDDADMLEEAPDDAGIPLDPDEADDL